MSAADYLSAAGWMRLGQRRDDAVVRWLRLHPDSELHEIAAGVGRPLLATHRRLNRLEHEGRIRSAWITDPCDLFHTTVYTTQAPATSHAAP